MVTWVRVVFCWWLIMLVKGAIGKQESCNFVHERCVQRDGCARALVNYMMWCSNEVRGSSDCSEPCQHALIVLLSTDEGQALVDCECNEDPECINTKKRVEICRPHVLRNSQNETMSCRVSQMICKSNLECSTALDYYLRNCRAMFHGKKCSHRCLNSINILRKQEKAAKMSTCKCDGFEDYDCPKVKTNMARLCFHKSTVKVDEKEPTKRNDYMTNEVNSAGVVRAFNISLLALVFRYLVFA